MNEAHQRHPDTLEHPESCAACRFVIEFESRIEHAHWNATLPGWNEYWARRMARLAPADPEP